MKFHNENGQFLAHPRPSVGQDRLILTVNFLIFIIFALAILHEVVALINAAKSFAPCSRNSGSLSIRSG